MALSVTERATAALKILLDQHGHEEGQVLRLNTDGQGKMQFTLDSEQAGDQVFEHDGHKVIVIEPSVSESLSGNTIDLKEDGSGFTLHQ